MGERIAAENRTIKLCRRWKTDRRLTLDYSDKKMTAAEAAAHVRSGDVVVVGYASSFAYELMDALWERRFELEDVTLVSTLSLKPSKMYFSEAEEHHPFRLVTFFIGPGERMARSKGMPMDFTSIHLSLLDYWLTHIRRADVVFLETTRPDRNGYMSYGPTGCALSDFAVSTAREVFAEANLRTPWITGNQALIHMDQIDGFVETDHEIAELPEGETDEVSEKIADIVAAEVPDGATIQLGIGGLSTAVGDRLTEKNDLGIHSELFSPPMMRLMKNGNVTNRKKGFMDGMSVFAFSMGTKEMFEYMDHNPALYGGTFPFVNDPRNIGKNKRMISINTAMAVDLYGSVSAECMGGKQYSGVGGQIDYVKGAQWSEGGKSIIAMTSCYCRNGKRQSRIVVDFPQGTAVTTPRSEVQYVATEYGMINLRELSFEDRVRGMIQLAHPDFREELLEQAREKHML